MCRNLCQKDPLLSRDPLQPLIAPLAPWTLSHRNHLVQIETSAPPPSSANLFPWARNLSPPRPRRAPAKERQRRLEAVLTGVAAPLGALDVAQVGVLMAYVRLLAEHGAVALREPLLYIVVTLAASSLPRVQTLGAPAAVVLCSKSPELRQRLVDLALANQNQEAIALLAAVTPRTGVLEALAHGYERQPVQCHSVLLQLQLQWVRPLKVLECNSGASLPAYSFFLAALIPASSALLPTREICMLSTGIVSSPSSLRVFECLSRARSTTWCSRGSVLFSQHCRPCDGSGKVRLRVGKK